MEWLLQKNAASTKRNDSTKKRDSKQTKWLPPTGKSSVKRGDFKQAKCFPLRKIPIKWNDFHQKEQFPLKGMVPTKIKGFQYIARLPLKRTTSTKKDNSK